jgi:hypothetical protein
MKSMFYRSKFNGDISNWDVSHVHEISYMFKNSEFTGDISKWNPIQVTTMLKMFQNSKFNGDIGLWYMPKCRNYDYMFDGAINFN